MDDADDVAGYAARVQVRIRRILSILQYLYAYLSTYEYACDGWDAYGILADMAFLRGCMLAFHSSRFSVFSLY